MEPPSAINNTGKDAVIVGFHEIPIKDGQIIVRVWAIVEILVLPIGSIASTLKVQIPSE
jgi:hypothetical protein